MRLVGKFSGDCYLSSATRPERVWRVTPSLEILFVNLKTAWDWVQWLGITCVVSC